MLSEVLSQISELATAAGLRVANVFHAGDGNLHPLVLFDETIRSRRSCRRALRSDHGRLHPIWRFDHG